jgi:branched-chain amino acid transport system substrate-binding protein
MDVILDLTVLDVLWAGAVSAAHIPVVGGNFSSQPFYTNPDFYPSGQTNDSIAYSIAATAKTAGANSLAQLYCAEAPQCQQTAPLIKAADQQLGVTTVYDASIAVASPDYTAECVAAQQAHAAALVIVDAPQITARVGQDCIRQGYKPTYVTEGTGFGPAQITAPGLKNNLWQPFPILPYYANAAPVREMNSVVDTYYPGLRNSSTWTEYAAQAWTGGLLIEKAVKASGLGRRDSVSPAEITTGLASLKGETLDGWSPPLTLAAGQPHPVDCWFTGRVQNGTASLVNNAKLTCQRSLSS